MIMGKREKTGSIGYFNIEDKNMFQQLYIDEGMTPKEIGEQLGCHRRTVCNYLKGFGIPVRSRSEAQGGVIIFNEKYRSLFQRLYINERLSIFEIAKQLNVSKSTIFKYLKKFDIPMRTVSEAMEGKKREPFTEKHRRNISEGNTGKKPWNWQGGISFPPYCPKFNYMKKEEIRNQYNRVCVIGGVSALQNGQRLSVDHIDENKKQGCDGIPFNLRPLSRDIHGRMQNQQNHLLLELLLCGNKRAELNYEFGGNEI